MHAGRARKFVLILSVALAAVAPPAPCASAPLSIPDRARYVFQSVGEDSGLGTVTPACLFQDRDGFIWIGTVSGLLRYDGTHLVKYGPGQGLPTTAILQVAQSSDGHIWVATRHGLAVGGDGSFRMLPLPDRVPHLISRQPMALQTNGRIFAATSRGLWIVEGLGGSHAELWSKEHGLPTDRVDAVYAATDGKVWFASGSGLGWVDPTMHLHTLPVWNAFASETILALAQDGKGRTWMRTARQLLRLDAGSNRVVQEPVILPPANDIGAFAIDRQGRLMVPTVAGLYLRNENRWDVIDRRRGLPTNAVISAMEDREGSYWLGLGGNGLQRWQGERTWSGWTDAEGLPDNVVWAELRDAQRRLWIGTNTGVAMWDEGLHDYRVWKPKDGLNGSAARQLALAADGSVWVLCHPGGLTRFDAATLKPEKIAAPMPDPIALGRGPDGRIWVSAAHSLKALRSGQRPLVFDDVGAPADILAAIKYFAPAVGNILWASGTGGLARYDGKTWSHFTRDDGLLSNALVEVVSNRPDEAWVRYADAPGVTRFRVHHGTTDVAHFAAAQGLASDEVFMLGLDHAGNAWAGGDKGVAEITPAGSIRRYQRSDGLLWDDLSEGGFWGEIDGTILFGTSGGLARFDPRAEASLPPSAPRVVITSAQLGGHELLTDARPRAGHDDNTLYAEFGVLSYRESAGLRCAYRLDGLESKATETGVREVRYPALSPGNYDLEISCRSASGVAGEPAHFAFQVLPAWWQQSWARGLAGALGLSLLYALFQLRTYSLKKERRRLELAVARQGQQLQHANQELREASLTDPLTGARNRRFFQMTIEADINQVLRSYGTGAGSTDTRNRDLVFYLIDADHFKEVNDLYGHLAGDEILGEMTRRIQAAARMSDVLVRWGGEEFMVVSRASSRTEATALASRILHAIGDKPFRIRESSQPIRRTCSIGWAAFPWFPAVPGAVSYETVVVLADQALYKAKQAGRNRAIGVLPVDGQGLPKDGDTPLTAEELQTFLITTAGPKEAKFAASGHGS
jgi:diguanylate cyclase (GGDEF)-like protein